MTSQLTSKAGQLDKLTRSLINLDHTHHEIHGGNAYAIHTDATPASGAALVLAFKTGPAPVYVHMFGNFASEAAAQMTFLEGPAWTTNTGTAVALHNLNRVLAGSKSSTVLEDSTGTFGANDAMVKDPTGLTGGTALMSRTTWADKKVGAESRAENEVVLAADTTYAIVITNNDAAAKGAEINATWYEHTGTGA